LVAQDSSEIIKEIEELQPDSVTVSGGSLFICVPEVAQYCLDHGIRVTIDLQKCRINPGDKGDEENLAHRRKELELGMEEPLHTFRNLKIRT
jgi:hypothetical protein